MKQFDKTKVFKKRTELLAGLFLVALGLIILPVSRATVGTHQVVDFDGDGTTDFAVVRNTGGGPTGAITWFVKSNIRQTVVDFDGDGKTDFAVVRNTGGGPTGAVTWFVKTNSIISAATRDDGDVSGIIRTADGTPVAGALVVLSGNGSRTTITDALGKYVFKDVDAGVFYTVTPSRANYVFNPPQEGISPMGQNVSVPFSASFTGGSISPLTRPDFFVRQQYLDFLNREPDETGFNFWANGIRSCGLDAACLEARTVDTSAAFFLSIEFQQTGYLVYRMYQTAYGDLPGEPVPLRYSEFTPDTHTISRDLVVNKAGWQLLLERNKQNFADDFVARKRFTALYSGMSNSEFVAALDRNAGEVLSPPERDDLVTSLASGSMTRAQVLRSVAENGQLVQREFNQAFVLMQYFGYLQRDPNGGPDTNFDGYNFWLGKLNSFDGNYRNAEMVKAFLTSGEYQQRFKQ